MLEGSSIVTKLLDNEASDDVVRRVASAENPNSLRNTTDGKLTRCIKHESKSPNTTKMTIDVDDYFNNEVLKMNLEKERKVNSKLKKKVDGTEGKKNNLAPYRVNEAKVSLSSH